MTQTYHAHRITLAENKYWFAGEPFDTLEEAEEEIDRFLTSEFEGEDDSEEQRQFDDHWQNVNTENL